MSQGRQAGFGLRPPSRPLLVALLLAVSADISAQTATYSKTEELVYHDDRAQWILGQVAQVKVNGVEVSATSFDATYALPVSETVFGKLRKTVAYDTSSAVGTGQRGTVWKVTDGNNRTTTATGWMRGIPQSIQHADGTIESAQVNALGWVTAITNEVGAKTCYAYDSMGRLAEVTHPSETSNGVCDTSAWAATTQAFEKVGSTEYGIPAGHWRQTVSTGTARKVVYFDGLWRPLLTREYDAADETATRRFQRFAYDYAGRTSFAAYPGLSDALTTGTYTYYDVLGRPTMSAQDSELGLLATYTDYLPGFQVRSTNPRGVETVTQFQAFDQPGTQAPVGITTYAGADTAATLIARDVHGKPTAITRRNADGTVAVTRSYAYNPHHELCRTVEPETGTTLMGYDAAGNLSWSAAGLSSGTACEPYGSSGPVAARRVLRGYDTRNRLTSLAFPDGNGNQTWSYHADGLPSTVSTLNGGSTVSNAYTYNKRRLLTGESMVPDTLMTTWGMGYGYNSLGQVVTENYPAGVVLTYGVNALGQATQVNVSVPNAGTSTVVASGASYHPNGALKQFTYGNGIVHTMTQNARQLPARSTDGSALDLSTSFDANGNVTAVSDHIAARQDKSLQYDAHDRLVQAVSPMFGTASYGYDALDNLLTVVAPGRTHTYVYSSNRLGNVLDTASGQSVIGLAYDAQGNLANKNGVATVFDYGNRLRQTTGLTYRYDADGRRVRQDASGGQLEYSYYAKDGRLVWQRDEPENKRVSHIYFAGSLIAELVRPINATTETITYLHTDALGSPIARTNTAGSVIQTSEYEPYGKLLNRPNDDRPGYTGHVMDAASGLTYMQQRYVDPQLGLFLSVDPVTAYSNGDVRHFNRYAYANNNPYRFTDPDGRQSVGEMIDSGAEGCGPVSCAGWAALNATWQVFGAEGISQIADKGWSNAGTGSRFGAGWEAAAVIPFAKVARTGTVLIGSAQWTKRAGMPSGHGFRQLREAVTCPHRAVPIEAR